MKSIINNIRRVAFLLLLIFSIEIVSPLTAFALTGGPSQPEVQSFQPVGASDMVDLFTGDFSYNIPLLDVDGYPINLSYSSGISNDQEASWVGLGWNINPGVINRAMRGIPDEFSGDRIIKKQKTKRNLTINANFAPDVEFFGKPKTKKTKSGDSIKYGVNLAYSLGMKWNNYTGFSIEPTLNAGVFVGGDKGTMSGGLGLTSTSSGLTISPDISYEKKIDKLDKESKRPDFIKFGLSTNYNALSGFSSLTISKTTMDKGAIDDNKKKRRGAGAGSINIGIRSYTPAISMPLKNFNGSFTYKFGPDAIGFFPNATISGSVSEQHLNVPETGLRMPAYGYNNTDKAVRSNGEMRAVQDVNRDWDMPYSKNTPALPITNFTYDFLSVSGHGVGGTFRPFRGDYGYVSDNYARNISVGASMGLESGFGNTNETGFKYEDNVVTTTTKTWVRQNRMAEKFYYQRDREEADYEAYTYKQLGELSVDDEPEFYNMIQNDKAVKVQIEKGGGFQTKANNVLVDAADQTYEMSGKGYRTKRLKRNQTLTIVSQKERIARGDLGAQDLTNIPGHHTSEITVTRNDGARYIYGIPAYNRTQEQVSFAIGMDRNPGKKDRENFSTFRAKILDEKGVFRYKSEHNKMDNEYGVDNFYSNTIMPAYAHSYLLTCVLSSDYVDSDMEPGPSDHDIGNYTRFEYEKLPELYKWRTPYENFEANYNEGLKSDFSDDQASYVYGEKEVWFLSKIESKNTIAIFHTSARHDGYGVANENGGRSTSTPSTHKLDKISLYSKKDYEDNGQNAVPIKEVHFEYDYHLCPNVPNNDGQPELDANNDDLNEDKGKLTLTRVYFTYGNSNKAKFSPYVFDYSDFNPDYGLKNYDRWGNYKAPATGSDLFDSQSEMTNSENPYVGKDKTNADLYASAWTLKSINLPSGGTISIEVEADDYAYVQDEVAHEMFRIVETGNSEASLEDASPTAKLMDIDNNDEVYQWVKFPLKSTLDPSTTDDEFKEMYTQGIENNIYFKCLVDITGKQDYEYVNGYCQISDAGLVDNGGSPYEYGWLKINKVPKNSLGLGDYVHPISKAAWTFGLNAMPQRVIGKDWDDNGGFKDFLRVLGDATFVKGLVQAFKGPNDVIKSNGGGVNISSTKSLIRLKTPDLKKIGGGLRVKKILVSDEWATMANAATNPSQVIGSEYSYTMQEDRYDDPISSGVAAWEPAIGNDENPLRIPIYYGDEDARVISIKNVDYLEGPIGESFYPNPSVGYRTVTVKSLSHNDINRHATGKTVHKFYTAKEFPVISEQTSITPVKSRTPSLLAGINPYSRDHMAASQGYAIQVNDMHGKQRSVEVYQEGNTDPISGAKYIYQSDPYEEGSWKLNNTCTVVRPDGSTDQREIGVEFDFVMDFRQQQTLGISRSVSPQVSTFLAAFLPGVVPSIWPGLSVDDTRFRSAVTTKVINRYGILSEVVAFDLGSEISTKNLAYDSETGLVLLTQTVNEFEDDIYNFNYPAHWYYDGMGQAYKNLGLEFASITLTSGILSGVENAHTYFVPGDELLLDNKKKAWVLSVNGEDVTIINKAGGIITGTYSTLKIIRSGRRNMIGVGMGSMVTMENPLPFLQSNQFNKVLNTSTQEYKEDWETFCECYNNLGSPMISTSNPYLNGVKGTWRPFKSYAYLTPRNHTWDDNNTNIREDGIYSRYNPFWIWGDNAWGIDQTNWTWTSEITKYTPYGAEIENMDALYRYSSAVYGYNKSIPTAVGSNMQYREIAFDGFEDYDYSSCADDHFSYRPYIADVTEEAAHTGRSSLKTGNGDSAVVIKTLVDCEEGI